MSYLIYTDQAQGQAREEQLSAALGYPTEIYPRYADLIEHPEGGQWALIVTSVCDVLASPPEVRDVADMLTAQERAALITDEQMREAGWFPEPEEDVP